ncbi:MAG: divalent-cation tolerance protein CutA [Verrucomicrobiota bacterium]
MTPLLVQVSVGNSEEAKHLASLLVENKLASCVQCISGVDSIYSWKGEICRDSESLLLIKSSEEKWNDLIACVKQNHSYECPEIVSISPYKVEEKYLKWWQESLEG